jgi:hypothetical protein
MRWLLQTSRRFSVLDRSPVHFAIAYARVWRHAFPVADNES